ncbi:MAG: hypothetical protein K2Q03_03790 [Sphingobacteriaceae bacterium]|nr:hypothetical protein [Sphingobacteriaceae bacterium]
MQLIKITKIERKRLFTLVLCLLLAIFAWLMMILNKTYLHPIKAVLIYENVPKKSGFKPLQSDTVILKVNSTGWQLMFSKMNSEIRTLKVDLKELETENKVFLIHQLRKINQKRTQKILSIDPSVLYFDFSTQYSKQIPIRFVNEISFLKPYGLLKEPSLYPKFVTVYGEKKWVDSLKFWNTNECKVLKLEKDTTFSIALKNDDKHRFNIYPNRIKISIEVDEYTEKELDIPIKIANNKHFDNVKIWPKTAKCVVLVPLSRYKYINEKSIELSVDLLEWREKKHTNLSVKQTRLANQCKMVSMVPNVVDFIIEK